MSHMKAVSEGNNFTEHVFDQLRRAIETGELEPGELYSATSLGEQLGVSRTPIREASLELARLGMVRIERNRGIRITATTVESLLEGFEVRLMLEVPLTRRATRRALHRPELRKPVIDVFDRFRAAAEARSSEDTLRADRDFHNALLAVSGNQRAVHILNEQRNLVLKSGVGTVPESRSPQECFEDHADVYDHFIAGDGDAAAVAMDRHIRNTGRLLIAQEGRRRKGFDETDFEARLQGLFD